MRLTKAASKRKNGSARPKRVRPSAKAVRVLKRLADEDRIPRRWMESTDDPTSSR